MPQVYARFAASPIGPTVIARDSGLTVHTLGDNAPSVARSDLVAAGDVAGAEFVFWGDAALLADVGVLQADAWMGHAVGSVGVAWNLSNGSVYQTGVVVLSGLPIPQKNEAIGVRLVLGPVPRVEWYHKAALVGSCPLATAVGWHFGVSLTCAEAGKLSCVVNAGQWQGVSAAVAQGGWRPPRITLAPLRLATEDYMSASTDVPANTPYLGVLTEEGLDTLANVAFWPWSNESRSGVAQAKVEDADGALDGLALSEVRGLPVVMRQVYQGEALATAQPVARYRLDRIDIEDDARKVLVFSDAHDLLDEPLNRAVFLPSISAAVAWQPQPVVIGAVRSLPSVSVSSDGSTQWLSDAPLASVAAVSDRGAPLTGYALVAGNQQMTLVSPPLGPVTLDVSSVGPNMQPAPLRAALVELFGRVGETAWAATDAMQIDAATGYAGIGFYANDGRSARAALPEVLSSYAADWYVDVDGQIRIARLIDPDAAESDAFDLEWRELKADLVVMPDLAPNLSRRMGYQVNAQVLGEGDLITDQVLLPASARARLTAPYRGQVYGAGPLAARYAHAETAAPIVSRFDRREDAQAEIDRVVALYRVPRNFYVVQFGARIDLRLRPGQIGRLTYPRYGLANGRRVLVASVASNPATGTHTMKFWGA